MTVYDKVLDRIEGGCGEHRGLGQTCFDGVLCGDCQMAKRLVEFAEELQVEADRAKVSRDTLLPNVAGQNAAQGLLLIEKAKREAAEGIVAIVEEYA